MRKVAKLLDNAKCILMTGKLTKSEPLFTTKNPTPILAQRRGGTENFKALS